MYVALRGSDCPLSILTHSSVSGDHTRTIQIATPTVGGLMKFAVKTVTCLGCKTALRPNNSVKGTTSPLPLLLLYFSARCFQGGAVCNNCRPRLGVLYQKQVSYFRLPFDAVHLAHSFFSRFLPHPLFKSASLVFGHNVNGVKDRCIKYVYFSISLADAED